MRNVAPHYFCTGIFIDTKISAEREAFEVGSKSLRRGEYGSASDGKQQQQQRMKKQNWIDSKKKEKKQPRRNKMGSNHLPPHLPHHHHHHDDDLRLQAALHHQGGEHPATTTTTGRFSLCINNTFMTMLLKNISWCLMKLIFSTSRFGPFGPVAPNHTRPLKLSFQFIIVVQLD